MNSDTYENPGVKLKVKFLFRSWINDEHIEEFARWAFGKDYINFSNGEHFVEAWNKLHGYDLKIDVANSLSKDGPKMVDLWYKTWYD